MPRPYNPQNRTQVRFRPDPIDNAPIEPTHRQARKGRDHGRRSKGNPSRSDGAAAPMRDTPPLQRLDTAPVAIACPCGWSKTVARDKVVASYRGHWGYAHAGHPLPTPAQCRDAIADIPRCPTCGHAVDDPPMALG